MRRAAATIAALAAIVLGVAGCETTQSESAKIGRKLGHQSAVAGQTSLGSASRAVVVKRKVLLSAGGSSAVALELVNDSAQAQVAFPVLIDVTDAAGKSVYRNNTKGIEPSLQQLALLPPHSSAWWVDNEVLASVPRSVSAQIGSSTATAPASLPQLQTSGVSASASFPGPHVSATVANQSMVAQSELAVYAVILKGTALVGAGRAVIASLAAGTSTQVLIPVIGTIDGRTIVLTTEPSQLH
jgi:hypothetical protein